MRTRPDEHGDATGEQRRERWGWVLVLLLTAVLGASWLPLSAPFGNDHDGRNLVLNAMQVEQVRERGLVATDFGSSLAPYVERETYAHHPPAMKLLYLPASFLPMALETSTRLVSYATGLLVVPGLALLLRRLRVGWAGVLVALAALSAVPLWWAYGRLHGPLGLTVVLAAVVADLRERDEPSGWHLAGAGALAAFVVASNWFGLAAAALLGLWLLAGRRRVDRTVLVLGACMAVSAVLTLLWVVGLSGPDDIGTSIGTRATDTGIAAGAWAQRMVRWFDELVPLWFRLLAALSLVGGLVRPRLRAPYVAGWLLAVGWVAGLPGGSYVHDYWILPVVLPVAIGLAGTVDLVLARTDLRLRVGVAALATAVGCAGVVALDRGQFGEEYERAPRDMALAAAQVEPPPGQDNGWHVRIPGLVTVAWAWGIPAEPLDAATLAATGPDAPGDDELVVVRLDRPPFFLPDDAALAGRLAARAGDYGVVTVGALRELAAQ